MEHSKSNTASIVAFIGNDPHKFEQLVHLLLSRNHLEAQRAAWPLSYCVEAFPTLALPYLDKLVIKLKDTTNHLGVKRNILRSLQFVDIPESLQGTLLDICLDALANKKEPVAIKVFAMTVAYNIGRHEPSLMNELRIIIEDQMPYALPGFKSRGSKILKAMDFPLDKYRGY